MRPIFQIAITLGLACGIANAGDAPKQNHHCKLADGTMEMAKTKRECKAAKGTWAKDASAAAPAAADTRKK